MDDGTDVHALTDASPTRRGLLAGGAIGVAGLAAGAMLNPATAEAVPNTYLMPAGNNGDDAPAFAQAVVAGGVVTLGPGTFLMKSAKGGCSAALVQKNTPVAVTGSGRGVTIVRFASPVEQLLGFNKTTDGDTFTDVTVQDLTVDAGGVNHFSGTGAVVGTCDGQGSGTFLKYINLDRITVRNVHSKNVPVDDSEKAHVGLSVTHNTSNETAKKNTITNITVEDVIFEGGASGVLINGNGPTAGVEIFVDHIQVRRWSHDTGVPPTPATDGFYAANVQIASFGHGGTDIVVADGYGANSADVGVEIDAVQQCRVENVVIVDCWNAALYQTNFRAPQDPSSQRIVFARCHARRIEVQHKVPGFAFKNNSGVDLGSLVYSDCSYFSNISTLFGDIAMALGTLQGQTATLSSLVVCGFRAICIGMSSSGTALETVAIYPKLATSPSLPPDITLRDIEIAISGATTGGNQLVGGILIAGAAQLTVDRVSFDMKWTSAVAGSMRGIDLGRNGATVNGSISHVAWKQASGDSDPRGIIVRGTSTLNIPTGLVISEIDASKLATNGAAVSFGGAQPKVTLRDIVWPVPPRGRVSEPSFPATTIAQQNTSSLDVLAVITNGSGAITQVAIDGVNTGLQIAAGATAAIPIAAGATVKFTYASGSPTWTWVAAG